MSARRDIFDGGEWARPPATAHAGLWLDRFVQSVGREDKETYRDHVKQVAVIPEPAGYAAFFHRWKKSLEGMRARGCAAKATGRIILGLGNESVIETSISLHRTYGVPYLPGSALKGVAASFAHHHLGEEWKRGGESHVALFGATDTAGYVNFYDALLIPKVDNGYKEKALYPDVLTVHHQDYYSGEAKAPADWDSPNPVSFLSAVGCYWVALGAPAGCEAWVDSAYSILEAALKHTGIGAKTSSGYGRLQMEIKAGNDRHNVSWVSEAAATPPPPLDPEQKLAEDMIARIRLLPAGRVAPEIAQYAAQWKALPIAETHKRKIAGAILKKIRGAGREKKSSDKAWYQELLAAVQES